MNKIGVLLYTSLDLRKFEVYDIIFKKTSPFYHSEKFIALSVRDNLLRKVSDLCLVPYSGEIICYKKETFICKNHLSYVDVNYRYMYVLSFIDGKLINIVDKSKQLKRKRKAFRRRISFLKKRQLQKRISKIFSHIGGKSTRSRGD